MKNDTETLQCRWTAEGDFRFAFRQGDDWVLTGRGTLLDVLDEFVSEVEAQGAWVFDRSSLVVTAATNEFPFADARAEPVKDALMVILDHVFNAPSDADPTDARAPETREALER